jgi:VirE N-terminal domain.
MKVKELLDLKCSFFNNTYSKPVDEVSVRSLFDGSFAKKQIKLYEYTPKDLVQFLNCTSAGLDKTLAKHVEKHGKDAMYSKLKEYQFALTPSGIFGERRTYEYLKEVNPLVVIDIDNITDGGTKKMIDSFKKEPWVLGAGESMSRQGIYLLAYIENPALLREHFLSIKDHLLTKGIKADDLKDITRLRYISYGYQWIRKDNETAKPWTQHVPIPTEDIYEVKQLAPTTQWDSEETINEMLTVVGTIDESGGLHPWTTRIASRCNRKGISNEYGAKAVWDKVKNTAVVKDTPRYTFDRFKIDWDSIYETYKHEHHQQTKVRISKSKIYRFNKKIYDASPKVLQELISLVEQDEEKEVIYFTAIVLLGTLFPNRCFRYFNNHYYLNLFGYILGEAASFKGKAKIIRQALKPYQKKVDDLFKERIEARDEAVRYNKNTPKGQERKPVDKIPDLNYFFDGNTSSAAMLKAMQDSPVLVMFETEGDTIAKTWKTDWGNYSDIFRKASEHESLYSLKKNGNEENLMRIRIDKPKLSVLVSSTESQMRKVLSADEAENGLMSRFLFYIVPNDKKWYDGWSSNTEADIGAILTKLIDPEVWMQWTVQNEVHYTMSKEAYQYHQDYFNQINDNWPDELFSIISLIRRAGTATARIAVLIEELNYLENPKKKTGLVARQYTVSGETMMLAIEIMKVLLQHLFVAWQITYKQEDDRETNVQTSDTRAKVIDLLTKEPAAGYKKVANELGISRELARHHVREARKRVVGGNDQKD